MNPNFLGVQIKSNDRGFIFLGGGWHKSRTSSDGHFGYSVIAPFKLRNRCLKNGPDPELEVEEFANFLIKSTLLDDLVGEIIDSLGFQCSHSKNKDGLMSCPKLE